MAHRALTTLLSTAFALSLSACGGGTETEGVACTTEVRTSVLVNAVDTSSAPIPSASVTYQINDGPAQIVVCPVSGACPVGAEQAGRFKLTVSKVGYVSAAAGVQVNRDVCHVFTEQVTVVLRKAS